VRVALSDSGNVICLFCLLIEPCDVALCFGLANVYFITVNWISIMFARLDNTILLSQLCCASALSVMYMLLNFAVMVYLGYVYGIASPRTLYA